MKEMICDHFQYVQIDDKKSLLERGSLGANFRPVVV